MESKNKQYLSCSFDNQPCFEIAQKLSLKYHTLKLRNELNESLKNILMEYSIDIGETDDPRFVINMLINKYYPSETLIKSSFADHLIKHTRNQITLFEFPLGRSRVDMCKINGSSIAYEIKTDLDSLLRLEKQISDYMDIFDETYVICSKNKLRKVLEVVPVECGIYTYNFSETDGISFKKVKSAIQSLKIDANKQLGILNKNELQDNFSTTDQKMVLSHVSNIRINKVFKICLKERYREKWAFLVENRNSIYSIDYQWFYKYNFDPTIIYE